MPKQGRQTALLEGLATFVVGQEVVNTNEDLGPVRIQNNQPIQ